MKDNRTQIAAKPETDFVENPPIHDHAEDLRQILAEISGPYQQLRSLRMSTDGRSTTTGFMTFGAPSWEIETYGIIPVEGQLSDSGPWTGTTRWLATRVGGKWTLAPMAFEFDARH